METTGGVHRTLGALILPGPPLLFPVRVGKLTPGPASPCQTARSFFFLSHRDTSWQKYKLFNNNHNNNTPCAFHCVSSGRRRRSSLSSHFLPAGVAEPIEWPPPLHLFFFYFLLPFALWTMPYRRPQKKGFFFFFFFPPNKRTKKEACWAHLNLF